MTAAPTVERYLRARDDLTTPLPRAYNIAAAVCDRWAATDPSRPALLVPDGPGVLTTVTFEQLRERSSRFANALSGLGVARGSRVGVCLGQTVECATAHLAVQRIGAIAVPLSVMAGSEAVRYRILDSGATVVVADAKTHAWVMDDNALRDVTWVMVGDSLPGARSLEDLVAAARATLRPASTTIDDPALIIYTSGTTGPPKGVLHAQRVVPAHAEPISLAQDLFPFPDDVFWSPADWAWAGGLVDGLFAALNAGCPVVAWRPKFDPEKVLDMLERIPITNTFLPPTALKLLREVGVRDRRLTLRAVMTGGERCGEDTIGWAREDLGLTPNEVYGQTEVSAVLGNSSTLLPVKPGAIGMEYPRVRAAILDDGGDELPSDQLGEIALHRSTPALFLGYWDGHGTHASDEEWHRTGDLGRRDDEGYFWHEGRRDDLILSAGYRIGPGEVEECLARHPAVRAVAVIGESDRMRGQIVSAIVELRDDALGGESLEEDLRSRVRRELAPYEVPRRFHVVDALPRTDSGKIKRAELRAMFS